MNYQKHYDALIETRRTRVLCKSIRSEKHHIVMKSLGGTNDKSNIISLTLREHFIAHHLLWKIHRNKQTACAFKFMCTKNKKWSSKIYEELRSNLKLSKETKIKIGISNKGKITGHKFRLGIKHSEETKAKIGIGNKGKTTGRKLRLGTKHTEESKKKMSLSHLGAPGPKQSEEAKARLGARYRGKKLSDAHRKNIRQAAIASYVNGKIPWNKGKLESIESKLRKYKIICQYDLSGNMIKEWSSAIDIHNELGYLRSSISICCNGKRDSYNGFIWKFKISK